MPFIAYLEGIGAPVDDLLSDVNLDRSYFIDPNNLVPEPPIWACFELAAERLNIPDLGFKVTEKLSLDSYGVFGATVMGAEHLNAALQVFIEQMGQQSNCPPFWLKPSEQGVWFYRLGTQGIKRGCWQVEQHVVSLMIQLVRGFTTSDWTPPFVDLQTNTIKGAEHCASFFNSQVVIGKEFTGIFIPSSILFNKPVIEGVTKFSYSGLFDEYIPKINSQVLKSLINQSRNTRDFTIEKTAQALDMSVRKMQRLLKEEGITFRHLTEQVLLEQAKVMLRGHHNIIDIAIEFGYSDAANFTRAFKRWSGVSPTVFRENRSL